MVAHSLGPRPFPRMRKNLKRGRRKKRRKGLANRVGLARATVGMLARLEWNSITIIMISRPTVMALSSFAIEMAVRCACDIRGSSSLKEKHVEAITALMRERDVFVCLPTGSISRCCAMHS